MKLRMAQPRVPIADTSIAKPAPKVADPFYHTPEWRALMGRIVAARGRRCQDPQHIGDPAAVTRVFGDHVVELKDGGAPLDEHNVMLRCGSCHTRKTNEARAKRMMARPS